MKHIFSVNGESDERQSMVRTIADQLCIGEEFTARTQRSVHTLKVTKIILESEVTIYVKPLP